MGRVRSGNSPWKDRLAQAEHDLGQAVASQRDGRHAWACFTAHQTVENAVKAIHLFRGRIVRGHVTSRLLSQLSPPPPPELIDRARVLDNYYLPTRYPNGHVQGPAFEHYGLLQSSQAVTHARHVLCFVREAVAPL